MRPATGSWCYLVLFYGTLWPRPTCHQQHKAPQTQYLDCVTPASDIASRQRLDYAVPVVTNFLCRATNFQLTWSSVLRYRWTNDLEFAVGWPRWSDVYSDESFRRSLKTFLFAKYYSVSSALQVFLRQCAIKIDIVYPSIYLFTYMYIIGMAMLGL